MKAFQKNPVFWLMWAIPAAAVFAGSSMVVVAMHDADRALPGIYHWEGELLEADFERARLAARLGLRADLVVEGGHCVLTLTPAPLQTEELQMRLTNAGDLHLDRAVSLVRQQPGRYRADCQPLQRGRWRVALQNAANTWALRAQLDDSLTRVAIVARDPEGRGP
jgi:hypothetical protein